MIKRYEVMWKSNGDIHPLIVSGRFFTKSGAIKKMHNLNLIGRHIGAKTVAIVWDHKLNRQISTSLYKD